MTMRAACFQTVSMIGRYSCGWICCIILPFGQTRFWYSLWLTCTQKTLHVKGRTSCVMFSHQIRSDTTTTCSFDALVSSPLFTCVQGECCCDAAMKSAPLTSSRSVGFCLTARWEVWSALMTSSLSRMVPAWNICTIFNRQGCCTSVFCSSLVPYLNSNICSFLQVSVGISMLSRALHPRN